MKNLELYNENHEATYCPEDDKLRLYVDRVPKEEYLALRSEGWKSTPKQDCDFVAVWTTSREDTALSYAGIILDEDQGPADRAADRAERFGGYLDKRRAEAHGHADTYESGPQAHGYQNQQKAERAAARHDRHADRALDAWSKAEYWQSRTAGVISNALYKSTPGVRMGRIKKLESEQRKIEKAQAENNAVRDMFAEFAKNNDTEAAAKVAYCRLSYGGPSIVHPRLNKRMSLSDAFRSEDPITAAEASEALQKHYADGRKTRGQTHIELRLAYENQMLEAAGGRAGDVEMKIGGTFTGGVIAKINKSPATGRAVSVAVIVPKVDGWAYKISNTEGTEFALMQIGCERAAPGAYAEPTEASLAKLKEYKDAVKATNKTGPKLINPTLEEAQRLQTRLNSDVSGLKYSNTPADVTEWTQAQYSDRSRGSDCVGTELFEIDGNAFKVRALWRMGAHSVVCITDKPQKGLPAFFPSKPEPKPEPVKAARIEKQEKEKAQLRAFMDGKADTATIKPEASQRELFGQTELF